MLAKRHSNGCQCSDKVSQHLASLHLTFPFLFILGVALSLFASSPALAEPYGFGTESKGGLGGEIVRVTTLDPEGPGSLRAAVEWPGPRLIVFEIGGQINLKRELIIKDPNITIAGQTAPPPGITLVGAGVVVKTHDVVLEHLRIRLGDGPGPSPHNRDGISVEGHPSGKRSVHRVLIDNCSIAWAIDEGVTFLYPGVREVTVRDTIIAESLSHSLHPKGEHSMALLVGKEARKVAVLNNLLAHNTFRNPVVAAGASAFIANNVIYDFGLHAIHVYGDKRLPPPTLAAVGNVGILGASNRGQSGLVYIPPSADPGTVLFLRDNIGPMGALIEEYLFFEAGAPHLGLVDEAPFWPQGFRPLAASDLEETLLTQVGAWPAHRDAVDRRVVEQVQRRTGMIIDSPVQVGGLETIGPSYHSLDIPGEVLPVHSEARERALANWLSDLRQAIGDLDD